MFGLAILALFCFGFYFFEIAKENQKLTSLEAKRFETLLNLAPVGIFLTDTVGRCTFVNSQWSKLTGLTLQEALGDGWAKAIHPEDSSAVFTEWTKSVDEKRPFLLNYRFKLPNKKINWVQGRSSEIQDQQGKVTGYLGSVLDLTEIRELETKQKQEHELLMAIIEALPVGLICKDSKDNYKFTIWNKEISRIVGIPKEKALGATDFDFWPGERATVHRSQDVQVLKNGEVLKVPQFNFSYKGSEKILRTSKFPVKDSTGENRFLLGIIDDITHEVQNERIIEEQKISLVKNDKLASLGVLASGIAHEINNPLAIIQGKADFLKNLLSSASFSPEKAKDSLEKISLTTKRIARIVKGLKTLARDGSKDPVVEFDLAQITQDTLEILRAKAEASQTELKVAIPKQEFKVMGHPDQISQVILNLISNSLDAIESLSEKWISIDILSTDSDFQIVIKDSGRGIPTHLQPKIFDPFFTTKEVGKGTGLGLSISYQLIEAHGGLLTLDTTQKNTTFNIRLPRQMALKKEKAA